MLLSIGITFPRPTVYIIIEIILPPPSGKNIEIIDESYVSLFAELAALYQSIMNMISRMNYER